MPAVNGAGPAAPAVNGGGAPESVLESIYNEMKTSNAMVKELQSQLQSVQNEQYHYSRIVQTNNVMAAAHRTLPSHLKSVCELLTACGKLDSMESFRSLVDTIASHWVESSEADAKEATDPHVRIRDAIGDGAVAREVALAVKRVGKIEAKTKPQTRTTVYHCFSCGEVGHTSNQCPAKARGGGATGVYVQPTRNRSRSPERRPY